MKRARFALGALVALMPVAGGAATDRILQNLHGIVTYQTNDGAQAHALARSAMTALADDDVAATGVASMGAITLPDSSKIVMASNSVLKLDTFSDDQVARAHFVIFNGKMRFSVEHSAGAKANYTFTTPTAEIAVRGTLGDISVDPLDGVRVNVYTASVPVEISMIDGEHYSVPMGQKIWMRWTSGKLIARVTPITQAEIDRFAELGPPGVSPSATPAP